jgi:hypothetical protein
MNDDTPIQRELPPELDGILTAHDRRARLIVQLHEQAMERANSLLRRQTAIKAGIAKDARRRKVAGWTVAGAAFILALGCVFALFRLSCPS